MVLHFIDDLNSFLSAEWQLLSSLLPQCQSAAFLLASPTADYDRLELVLGCLLLIANTRRYWITVDVVRNLNTDEEEENAEEPPAQTENVGAEKPAEATEPS